MKLRNLIPGLIRASPDPTHNTEQSADLLHLTGAATLDIQAATADGKDKPIRVNINAYDGDVMRVGSFGAVVLDLQGMELPPHLTLLADHESTIQGIVGSAAPKVESGKTLIANGTLSTATAAGQAIVNLHRDGVRFEASVGAEPLTRQFIRESEKVSVNGRTITAGVGGFTLVSKSRLREISLLPNGASQNTAVNIAAKESKMNTTDSESSTTVTAELERIEAMCIGTWTAEQSPKIAELRAQAIAGDIDMTKLSAGVLEIIRESRPKIGKLYINSGAGHAANSNESPANLIAAAVLIHAGKSKIAEDSFGASACNMVNDLRARSLMDICAMALTLEGRDVPRTHDAMLKAAFSTVSLPIALSDAMGKVALNTFKQMPATWRSTARLMPTGDFKTRSALRPYLANGAFEQVGPDGELKHAQVGEEVYTFKSGTYGKMYCITRQHIVNDDASIISELPAELARQGLRSVSDLYWALVMSNPSSFFGTGNKNYLTTGSALSITTFGTAVAKLRAQTDADGKPIDLAPAVLTVCPELEGTAKQLINSMQLMRDQSADQQGTGNPWQGSVKLEIEPRLSNAQFTGYSTTAWYLFADPMNTPATIVCSLDGSEPAPIVEQVDLPSNQLGIGYRGYNDVGAAMADPRAAVKATGAA